MSGFDVTYDDALQEAIEAAARATADLEHDVDPQWVQACAALSRAWSAIADQLVISDSAIQPFEPSPGGVWLAEELSDVDRLRRWRDLAADELARLEGEAGQQDGYASSVEHLERRCDLTGYIEGLTTALKLLDPDGEKENTP